MNDKFFRINRGFSICQDKKEAAMTVLNGHVVVSEAMFIYSVRSLAN